MAIAVILMYKKSLYNAQELRYDDSRRTAKFSKSAKLAMFILQSKPSVFFNELETLHTY